MTTVRQLIRRALERTRAIGVADFISNDEANNALYELQLIVNNTATLGKREFSSRISYNVTGSSIITIAGPGTSPGPTYSITSNNIPQFIDSVAYRSPGDTEYTVLPQLPVADEAIVGKDTSSGAPEYWQYAYPVSVNAPGTITFQPVPDQSYEYIVYTSDVRSDLTLDTVWPYGTTYEEYFLYALAAELAPSLGTDPTALRERAGRIMQRILMTTVVNVPEKESGEYSLMTNSFNKRGWGF